MCLRIFTRQLAILLCLLLLRGLSHCRTTRDLPGFRAHTLPRNDDGSTGQVPIGFDVNFFGHTYRTLYVNNNGNVTFQEPLATYIPFGLSQTNLPIIAAFFADVDTRSSGSGVVTYGTDIIDGRKAFGVNFFSVGYYSAHSDRLNTFQIVLIDRSDTGFGNFDIEFNYDQVQWDMGDAGRGRGDVAAVVGFSNGTRQANALYELPGSMAQGVFLDNGPKSLIAHDLNSNVPGRYIFQARSGTVSFLKITTAFLPEGSVAQPYNAPPLTASGGVPPYTWSFVSGLDRSGLALDPATAQITGTPAATGEYQVTIQVADTAGTPPARQTFTIKINGPPLAPYLIEPEHTAVNVPTKLVAGLRIAGQPAPLRGHDLPRQLVITANFSDQTVILRDDGLEGDDVAGDGRFTAKVTFTEAGKIPVHLQATTGTLERSGNGMVTVWGNLIYSGGPIRLDLGTSKAGGVVCRSLPLDALQQGAVPFEFRLLRTLPSAHQISLLADNKKYVPGSEPLLLGPGVAKEICLQTDRRALDSIADGQPWIELVVITADGEKDLAPVALFWNVHALSFWERWGSLILIVLAILLMLFIIYGYVKPYRFPRDLAITFVPEYEDLDTTPQPLAQWRGIGIGFYRNAHAFLHPDFRISGQSRGALGKLQAARDGVWIISLGSPFFREIDLAEWEEIKPLGRTVRAATVYRIGERGPFFRISTGAKRREVS